MIVAAHHRLPKESAIPLRDSLTYREAAAPTAVGCRARRPGPGTVLGRCRSWCRGATRRPSRRGRRVFACGRAPDSRALSRPLRSTERDQRARRRARHRSRAAPRRARPGLRAARRRPCGARWHRRLGFVARVRRAGDSGCGRMPTPIPRARSRRRGACPLRVTRESPGPGISSYSRKAPRFELLSPRGGLTGGPGGASRPRRLGRRMPGVGLAGRWAFRTRAARAPGTCSARAPGERTCSAIAHRTRAGHRARAARSRLVAGSGIRRVCALGPSHLPAPGPRGRLHGPASRRRRPPAGGRPVREGGSP
jgi:hypothetical protein